MGHHLSYNKDRNIREVTTMLNFCVFVFILYFFKKVFRMIFPKKVRVYKQVVIAQYANTPNKRKTPRKKSPVLYANNNVKAKRPYRKCA